MGQKVHPIGLRLGINKTWQSRWYADSREYADLVLEDLKIRKMIDDLPECKNADISHIGIIRHPQRVTIMIHTARPGVIIGQDGKRIEELTKNCILRDEKGYTSWTWDPVMTSVSNSKLLQFDKLLENTPLRYKYMLDRGIEGGVAYRNGIKGAIIYIYRIINIFNRS